MKKKIAIIICLMLYLGTSTGFAMHFHFCGKTLAKVQLNHPVKKTCCKKSEASKADNCCKNSQFEIRVSDEHAAAGVVKIPSAAGLSLFFIPVYNVLMQGAGQKLLNTKTSRPPPELSGIPLNLKNCVFLI